VKVEIFPCIYFQNLKILLAFRKIPILFGLQTNTKDETKFRRHDVWRA